jgi:hypothetical protein
MPRPASLANGGYFPTPTHLMPAIAGLINSRPAFEGRQTHSSDRQLSYGSYFLFDPCAGDGAALLNLAYHLFNQTEGQQHPHSGQGRPNVMLGACEMEQSRAAELKASFKTHIGGQSGYHYHALHADAFTLKWETDANWKRGANVLYLNPPYGLDPLYGRLENRFLERFTRLLIAGEGILIFVVPHYALSASASYLARHYEDIRAFRFPDGDFDAFKQVVLVARRVERVSSAAVGTEQLGFAEGQNNPVAGRIRQWAEDALSLPVLPLVPETETRLSLLADSRGGISSIQAGKLDNQGLAKAARPWCVGTGTAGDYPVSFSFSVSLPSSSPISTSTQQQEVMPKIELTLPTEKEIEIVSDRPANGSSNRKGGGKGKERLFSAPMPTRTRTRARGTASSLQVVSETGLQKGLDELVGQPFEVAMPPKPAHIAMALASGAFNGKRLDPDPNAPLGLPPLLAKGVFKKEYLTTEEKKNKKGEVTGLVQVQQPELSLHVLSLSDYRYYELAPGIFPSGKTDLARMNMADLLAYYGQSLIRLMAEQFPALHQPGNPEHQVVLPPLARPLFKAQAQAVMTALKLLAVGENPMFIAEVSTGKTSMALAIAGALTEANFAQVLTQIKSRLQSSVTGSGSRPGSSSRYSKLAKLRPVKRVLVVCPPHLLSTWQEEAATVLPGAKVVIVNGFADLEPRLEEAVAEEAAATEVKAGTGLTIYVLSRETAKLGHSLTAGVVEARALDQQLTGTVLLCPRCGRPNPTQAGLSREQLAKSRARCLHSASTLSRPENEAAQLAYELAVLLLTAYPEEVAVTSLTGSQRYLAALAHKAQKTLITMATEGVGVGVGSKGSGTQPQPQPQPQPREKALALENARRANWQRRSGKSLCTLPPTTKAQARERVGQDRQHSSVLAFSGTGTETEAKTESVFSRLVRRVSRLVLTTYHEEQSKSQSRCEKLNKLFNVLMRLVLALDPARPDSLPLVLELVEQLFEASFSASASTSTSATGSASSSLKHDLREKALQLLLLAAFSMPVPPALASGSGSGSVEQDVWLNELVSRLKTREKESESTSGESESVSTDFGSYSQFQAQTLTPSRSHWAYLERTLTRLRREQAEADEVKQGHITLEKLAQRRNVRAQQHSYSHATHQPDWYGFKIEPAMSGGYLTWSDNSSTTMSLSASASENVAGSPAQALAALKVLVTEHGRGTAGGVGRYQGGRCGEYLYQATPQPRRYPLARYIVKKKQNFFDLLILDEAHEYAGQGSAQGKAAHRLVELAGVPTVALTGSLMNGFAGSLFANFWSLSRHFRQEFDREDKQTFITRYGYRKVLLVTTDKDNAGAFGHVAAYGSVTDREERVESSSVRQLGEAPGVLPLFVLRHLLPQAVMVHKADLDVELPPCNQTTVKLGIGTATTTATGTEGVETQTQTHNQTAQAQAVLDKALLEENTALQKRVIERIRTDILSGGDRAGKLFGQMAELISYLDLASEDVGNDWSKDGTGTKRVYEVRYPESLGSEVAVHSPRLFPAEYLAPKERWLLATLRAELAEGRRVLIFVRHTGDVTAAPAPASASASDGSNPTPVAAGVGTGGGSRAKAKAGSANRRGSTGSGGGKFPPLVNRLRRLIKAELGEDAFYLDSRKVKAGERKEWLNREVIEREGKILILNPNTVKTGLNNLVWFSSAVWYELDHNALTFRQANGRLHRLRQTKPVRIHFPVYEDTTQELAHKHLSMKVEVSQEVDGLSLESALAAVGAGAGTDGEDGNGNGNGGESGSYVARQTAHSLGKAIYDMLVGGW